MTEHNASNLSERSLAELVDLFDVLTIPSPMSLAERVNLFLESDWLAGYVDGVDDERYNDGFANGRSRGYDQGYRDGAVQALRDAVEEIDGEQGAALSHPWMAISRSWLSDRAAQHAPGDALGACRCGRTFRTVAQHQAHRAIEEAGGAL